MDPLTIQTATPAAHPGTIILSLIGTADMANNEVLDRRLTQLCAQHPPRVIFDCSGLTFIASISIGALVRFHTASRRWGGRMILADMTPDVLGSLKRARLDQVFLILPTLDAALSAT